MRELERVWSRLRGATWMLQGRMWVMWAADVCGGGSVVLRHIVRVGGAEQWW